jgi:hypothetical protein
LDPICETYKCAVSYPNSEALQGPFFSTNFEAFLDPICEAY